MIKMINNLAQYKLGHQTFNIIALTSCFLISRLEATIVTGDPDAAPGTTFSFNIGASKYSQVDRISRLWLTSSQDISNDAAKSYALSFVYEIPSEPMINQSTGNILIPTAIPMANQEDANISFYNSTTNLVEIIKAPNPIYGKAFKFFDIFIQKPTFVLAADSELNKIYFGLDIQHYATQTATKKNVTDLLVYNLPSDQKIAAFLGGGDGIYAAYATGTFGTNPSTIGKFITTSQTQNEKSVQYIKELASEQVSVSTPALTNNQANLASLGSSVTLHFFSTMTYAGLETTANNGANDTATGIMIVNTVKSNDLFSLAFTPIANSNVISPSFDTVVSTTSNNTIRILHISSMLTSTSLHYMIIARDNGTGPQSIYAVPLVSKPGEGYGQIADFSTIENLFGTNPQTFQKRYFNKVLTDATQIQIGGSYDNQIIVGGTIPLASGNIENLYTVGDSVYIVIGQTYATGTQPGTFRSQAIFAADGHIIGWSPWSRALGSDSPMNYSNIGSTSTANFYVSDPTKTGSRFNTVTQTQWTVNQNLSVMFQYSYLPQGGTQGIFNFGQTTPGFNNEMSMIATTGFNNIALGQTGWTPTPNQFQIKNMSNSDIVIFNDVNNNGALVALELAHNETNHWLFAGGVAGLTVLTDTNGYTWQGNFSSIQNFNQGQAWKQVGSFSYIKKLVSDKAFLYVLTPKALYQIALDANKFTENPTIDLNPVIIATSSQFAQNAYFLDIIIDNDFCILGTTNGLYSFNTASGIPKSFDKITIPDGLLAATQLLAISTNQNPQKNFKSLSNLYVLTNNFRTQESRVNRFTIINETITPFNDAILNNPTTAPDGLATSFIKFNQFVSNYFTDGSWNLASNYFLGTTQPEETKSPSILQIYATVTNGKSSSQAIIPFLSAYVPSQYLKNVNMLLGVTRESTSGACIASGNFPARINA